jgi:hypothetical protein
LFAKLHSRLASSVLALAAAEAMASGAGAQSLNPMPVKPVRDVNGVDLANWTLSFDIAPISIGPADQDPIKLNINFPTERDSFYSRMRIQDPSGESSTSVTATIGAKTWSILGGGVISDPGAQFAMAYDYAKIWDRDGTLVDYEYPAGWVPGMPIRQFCARRGSLGQTARY